MAHPVFLNTFWRTFGLYRCDNGDTDGRTIVIYSAINFKFQNFSYKEAPGGLCGNES